MEDDGTETQRNGTRNPFFLLSFISTLNQIKMNFQSNFNVEIK